MQLWYNLLHLLNYYLNRNCLLRLETSIVSMSITSMFWNPSNALRKTVTDWSDRRLNLLNIHCTVISADFWVTSSRILILSSFSVLSEMNGLLIKKNRHDFMMDNHLLNPSIAHTPSLPLLSPESYRSPE